MANIEKINPLTYITDWTPVPETALDASSWFETEYLTIDFKWDYNSNAAWGPDSGGRLSWFMAQGWVVYDKQEVDIGPTAGVYEYTYYLKRRKMQSERVLQDMINEFTAAYNEGRTLNDRRYDEIVALYDVMLDKSTDEVNEYDSDEYDAIIDGIIDGLPTDADDYEDTVDALLDEFGVSHRERINTQFDNELAKARQTLIARGMFNTTVWESTSSGIELSRSRALNDLEDKIIERKLVSADRVQQIKTDLNARLESATVRLMELKRSRRFGASDFRNKIITAMLAFMERRSDEYPGIGQLAELASSLGYSEGGTVAPPSS